jgi:hypothetical protein
MESVTSLPQILGPRATTGLAVLAGYLLLVRKLRYLRRDRKHAEYPYKTREDFAKMTAEDAWGIVKYIMSLEFPFMSEKALSFALFKYGSLVRPILAADVDADMSAELTAYQPSRNSCVRLNSF